MEKLNKRSINISEFDMDTYVLVYNEKDWEGGSAERNDAENQVGVL